MSKTPEGGGLRLSSAVPKIHLDSNPDCSYGYQAMGNLYLLPKTHTGLQKIQKIPTYFMWRGIIMRKYPYIKLRYTFQYPTFILP